MFCSSDCVQVVKYLKLVHIHQYEITLTAKFQSSIQMKQAVSSVYILCNPICVCIICSVTFGETSEAFKGSPGRRKPPQPPDDPHCPVPSTESATA